MFSYSSGLNPNVVKTALDDVFKQEFEYGMGPGDATAMTAAVFKQDSADSSAVIMEVFKGSGYWDTRDEEQDVAAGTPRIGNQITFSVTNFAKSIDIPKNFFDDNKHGAYEKMVRDFAEKARITRDKNAFAIFRNGFTTTLTADGVALFSASHVTLSGDTVDNYSTAALADGSLNDAIVDLSEQKGQDGTIAGCVPAVLLVPRKLYKTACILTDTQLRPSTANNDVNVYSTKYGIEVYTSPFLGAAAGGSDTAWFLLSRNHAIYRWVRQGIVTDLVDYKFQRNNNYIYKGEFREVVGAIDYVGSWGSVGTA